MSDIRRHNVRHIPVLHVDAGLMKARFGQGCAMTNCTGKCCLSGVWLDPIEQGRILKHAARVQRYMDASQEKDPTRWFAEDKPGDADFPSGRAVGTAVAEGACVFLNSERRCVLQNASTEETGNLKPFFCITFPVVLDHGTLCLDDGKDTACCTTDPAGTRTVLDVCPQELNFVLGDEGLRELQEAEGLPPNSAGDL